MTFAIVFNLINRVYLEKVYKDNYIELLNIHEPYDRYVEATLSEEEIEKYKYGHNHFTSLELKELINKDYVESLYVVDLDYIFKMQDSTENIKIFSLPNLVLESNNYYISYPGTKGFLTKGRFPKDDKKEALISLNQMKTNFGYTGDIDDAIGTIIKINNEDYQVVGLTDIDVITISYDHNSYESYGFFNFQKGNNENLEKHIDRIEKDEYDTGNLYSNVFIEYKEGFDKELMDYLLENAPSYQYASNYRGEIVREYEYKNNFSYFIKITLLFTSTLILGLLSFGSSYFKRIKNSCEDYKKTIESIYKNSYKVLSVDYLILLPLQLITAFNLTGSNMFRIKATTLFIPFFILNFFIMIIFLKVVFLLINKKEKEIALEENL